MLNQWQRGIIRSVYNADSWLGHPNQRYIGSTVSLRSEIKEKQYLKAKNPY